MEHDFDLHLNKVGKKRRSGKMSRKWMKRCMAVLLSAVLATGTCLPALAADQPEAQEQAGSSGTTEAALTQPEENTEGIESPEEQVDAGDSGTETEENGEEAESPETAEESTGEETDQNAEEADDQNAESEEEQANTQEETADPETSAETNETSDSSEPEGTENLDEASGESETDDASTADSEEQSVEEQPEEVTEANESKLGSEEGETDAWLADYDYDFWALDDNTHVVALTSYNGADIEISVPGTATVNGIEYPVTCDSNIWPVNMERFTVGEGFIFRELGYFFADHNSLVSVDLSAADTSRVTGVDGMFSGCSSLRHLDLSGWDWSNVTDYWGFLDRCDSLEEMITPVYVQGEVELPCVMADADGNIYSKLPNYDSSIVLTKAEIDAWLADYEYDFWTLDDNTDVVVLTAYNGADIEISVPGTATVNGVEYPVTCDGAIWPDTIERFTVGEGFIFQGMGYLFADHTSLVSVDLSAADTSRVTGVDGMFSGCTSLQEVNLGNIDLSNVVYASNMFFNCSSIEELNLSCFSANSVINNCDEMISNCHNLKRIDFNGMDWSNVEVMGGDFFAGCESLEELVTPVNSAIFMNLPHVMKDDAGNFYNYMPHTSTALTLSTFEVPEWLSDYSYDFDLNNHSLMLRAYNGSKPDITIPASITIDNVKFTVVFSEMDWGNSVTSISFGEGFDFSNIWVDEAFRNCTNLEIIDLRNCVFSPDHDHENLLSQCAGLKTIYLPKGFIDNVKLPKVFKDEEGNRYTTAPSGLSFSITLQAVDCSDWLQDYCYSINEAGDTINLTGYRSSEEDALVHASAEVDGKLYERIYANPWIWSQSGAKSIKLENGVLHDEDLMGAFCYNREVESIDYSELGGLKVTCADDAFLECSSLKYIDLSGLDFSTCQGVSNCLGECNSLETIKTPVFVNRAIKLPGVFIDGEGCFYSEIPMGLDHSVTLTKAVYSDWLDDYNFTVSGDSIILLKRKEYCDGTITIPGNAEVGGKEFNSIEISGHTFKDSCIEELYFEQGVVLPNDCTSLFSMDSLRKIDLSEVDVSKADNMSVMFRGCRSLTTIVIPKNVTQEAYLPCLFTDQDGNIYSSFPKNVSESFEITKVPTEGALSDYEFYIAGDKVVLTSYIGFESDLVVPGSVTISGTTYNKVEIASGFKWGSVNNISFENGVVLPEDCSCLFVSDNLYSVDISNVDSSNVTNMSGMFANSFNLRDVRMGGIDTSNVTNMSDMFSECSNLETLDLSGINTSHVTDMRGMFYWCSSLTGVDVSGFDTSNVTNMEEMFYSCDVLTTLDVSGFDTSNVTNMLYMFSGCLNLTVLDVSGFDTSKVTNMGSMFHWCINLTELDVSGFNTANVTNMSGMFGACRNLSELDVSGFDTSNTKYMSEMFAECSSLTNLDVSGFDTSNTTDMELMFGNCSSLTSLDVSGFNMENVNEIGQMFAQCDSLLELDLSTWNLASVEKAYDVFYGSIPVIKAPANVSGNISLGAVYTGSDGLTYTKLPIGTNESILLTWASNLSGDPGGNVSGDPSVSGDPGVEVTKYQVIFDTENCTLTVNADYDDEKGGTPVENGDYVNEGTELTVTARPNNGYEMSETPAETYIVDGELTIIARADLKYYSLGLNHENGEEPSVDTGDLSAIPYGTSVTITAGKPDTGYEFIGWYQTNGKQLTAEEQYTFMMYGDVTYEARYQLKAGIVTFIANDKIVKTVTTTATGNRSTKLFAGNLKATDDSGIDDSDFPENPATLYGYTFTGWDKTAEQINTELADGGNVIVTAMFEEIKKNIVLTIYNGESGTAETREYSNSQWVSVTATPAAVGKTFAYWTMDGEILSYNKTATFRILSDCQIKAVYTTAAVEAVGTASIKTVTYDSSNCKLSTVAYLTVPEGAVIEKAGLFAASSGFDPMTQELDESTADYVKSSSKAVGTAGPVNYTWGKKDVNIGDVWYVRPYVSYDYDGEIETVLGTMVTVSAGNDYDSTEKGTASIISADYDSEASKAIFVAYLTIPSGGTIVKAGLVAAPETSFDPAESILTWENAAYQKVSSKAVGTSGPVTYTWRKSNVLAGDRWYARPYVMYKDADGAEHMVYGALASVTATQ